MDNFPKVAIPAVPTQTSPYQCSPCDCGFSAPQSERSITLIISNVVWAVFFVISEILGYTKKFKTKSVSELVTSLLVRHNESQEENRAPPKQESEDDGDNASEESENQNPRRIVPKTDKKKKKRSSQPPVSFELEEWQAYKDWKDLRDFRKYRNDRKSLQESYTPERGNTANSRSNLPPPKPAASSREIPVEKDPIELRRRTPSNDGDAK